METKYPILARYTAMVQIRPMSSDGSELTPGSITEMLMPERTGLVLLYPNGDRIYSGNYLVIAESEGRLPQNQDSKNGRTIVDVIRGAETVDLLGPEDEFSSITANCCVA